MITTMIRVIIVIIILVLLVILVLKMTKKYTHNMGQLHGGKRAKKIGQSPPPFGQKKENVFFSSCDVFHTELYQQRLEIPEKIVVLVFQRRINWER